MLLIEFSKKAFRMIRDSDWLSHIITFLISGVLIFVFYKIALPNMGKKTVQLILDQFINILSSIGILSAFFILALDKVNVSKIVMRFNRKIKNKTYSEGDMLINTIFSYFIINMLLIVMQFIGILFDIKSIPVLILNIVYMLFGFMIVVGSWQGQETQLIEKKDMSIEK